MTLYKKEKNPEIIFISPSILYGRYFDYDLSLAYVQAYLKERGIHSLQISQEQRISLESFVDKILKYNPKVVGILCSDRNYYLVKAIARAIKERAPSLVILVIGQIVTFADHLIIDDCSYVDMCVRGEGEYTIYEIIQFLSGFMQLEKIKGITYRKNGKPIRNVDRPLTGLNRNKGSELDILPSPYLSDVLTGLESVGILTSRGCSFGCTYCLSSAVVNHTIRYHSAGRVISEVKKIDRVAKYSGNGNGAKALVQFLDRDFGSDIVRAKEICRILIKEKFNLDFFCELRADRVDEELFELLYKAGFYEINFGLESAIPRILRNVRKVSSSTSIDDLTPERNFVKKFKENIELAKKIGLNPSVNIMLGLPGESLEDGKRTLEFVKELGVNLYYHHRLSLFPGTELFKTYKKYGLIRRDISYNILSHSIKHLYNVNRIPYHRNATQFILQYKELRYFTDIVFGCPWQKIEGSILKGNGGFPFIVFNNFLKIDKNLFRWIKDIMSINAYLLFITPYKFNRMILTQKTRRMLSMGLPTKEYHFLYITAKGVEMYFRLNPRPVSELPFSFKIVALSEIRRLKHKSKKTQIIVTLHSEEDIRLFTGLLGGYNIKQDNTLLNRLIDLNVSFLDGCRWLDKECFASNPSKLIIEKNVMKLCTCSEIIGRIGDTYDRVVTRLNRAFEEEKDKRNCQQCSVRDICSKCVYPYPMTAKEYCTLRKNNPQINTVMRLISSLRDFELCRDLIGYSQRNFNNQRSYG